jgi:hypothetical protein
MRRSSHREPTTPPGVDHPTGSRPPHREPTTGQDGSGAAELTIVFFGRRYVPDPSRPFFLGREGDLVVDDNPYLHRRFLMITRLEGLWWLANRGGVLAATVADESGHCEAYLAPGDRLPLVFPTTVVWFTAGPTTYELDVIVTDAALTPITAGPPAGGARPAHGQVSFTPSQRLLILALAEPLLRSRRGASTLPTSAQAAERLGWPLTTFRRRLDSVCAKLTQAGVRGLRGGAAGLAVSRRARLVEYAAAARVATPDLLPLLDRHLASQATRKARAARRPG